MNIVLLITLSAMWAPSFLLIKLAGLGGVPPLTLAFGRIGLAAAVLAVIVLARRTVWPRDRRRWVAFSMLGLFGSAIPQFCYAWGEMLSDSGTAAIINGMMPIFTIVIAHFFAGDEPFTGGRGLGVLLGFAGLLTMFLPESLAGLKGNQHLLGMSVMLLAPIGYAGTTVLARRALRGEPALMTAAAQMLTGALFLAPFSLAIESPWRISPSGGALVAIAFLGVLGTAIPMILYYRLLNSASATFASLTTYIMPPAAIVLGMVFLNEKPGWNALAGCALILAGVVAVHRAGARPRMANPAAAAASDTP